MANIDEPSRRVGARLRELRTRYEGRQEDVAREAQRFGLGWTRATVAALETGRRRLALNELLALPEVIRQAFGREVTPTDLLQGGQDKPVPLRLSSGLEISNNALMELLPRGRVPAYRHAMGWTEAARVRTPEPSLPRLLQALPVELHEQARRAGTGEAEQKVARATGVSPEAVGVASFLAWGRSLTDERERRLAERTDLSANPRTLQAIRGHISRRLLVRLREVLEHHGRLEQGEG